MINKKFLFGKKNGDKLETVVLTLMFDHSCGFDIKEGGDSECYVTNSYKYEGSWKVATKDIEKLGYVTFDKLKGLSEITQTQMDSIVLKEVQQQVELFETFIKLSKESVDSVALEEFTSKTIYTTINEELVKFPKIDIS